MRLGEQGFLFSPKFAMGRMNDGPGMSCQRQQRLWARRGWGAWVREDGRKGWEQERDFPDGGKEPWVSRPAGDNVWLAEYHSEDRMQCQERIWRRDNYQSQAIFPSRRCLFHFLLSNSFLSTLIDFLKVIKQTEFSKMNQHRSVFSLFNHNIVLFNRNSQFIVQHITWSSGPGTPHMRRTLEQKSGQLEPGRSTLCYEW